ncbi:MAG: hypothetical protein H6741_07455 [Alphaproteobacteria bacterium]|nr:hypothetical protein [Alphaproteobacteria bacterium]MCB9792551.1 hypothetical protein [Alphaproteobacteria bacterium]
MSEFGLNVAVIGATGAVGQELLIALARAPFPIAGLNAIASHGSTTPTVEFKDHDVPVRNLDADALEGVDLLFTAQPVGIGEELLHEAVDAGVVAVDVAGTWQDERHVPLVALGINSVEMEAVREVGVVRSPGPLGLALSAVGSAFQRRAELSAIRGTALMPASIAGREGIEELSGQVVAMFNSKDPPRKVFPGGLAFDLIPSWAASGEGSEDWSSRELRAARDAGRVLGLDPRRVAVSEVVAPIFQGMGLSLNLLGAGPVPVGTVRDAFEDSPLVQLEGGRKLGPRARAEEPVVAVGRLRTDPGGLGVHLWAAVDPLRLLAANAVSLAAELVLHEVIRVG